MVESEYLPSNDMQAFQQTLRLSKHVIVVAGAGLSAASGIPTFRGTGGMWRKYDAMSLATPEAFKNNPSRVWQFYHYRREKALQAQPNGAHLALAKFSINSVRDAIAPGSSFALITQNVDGLSQRAWNEVLSKAGSNAQESDTCPVLLEMHGRLFDVVCTSRSCGHRELDYSSPICPALAGTEVMVEKGVTEPDIPLNQLPRCKKCSSLARPGVVWFGEMPHYMQKIDDLVERADLCLVVGTSSTVYPAAGYASEVRNHGGKVAIFNLERSQGDTDADYLFLGPCEQTLPQALTLTSETT